MSQKKADFIKVPAGVHGFQTMPVEPENRIPESDIRLELCDASDAQKVAEGLYTCFPASFWEKKEPPELRPPEQSTRVQRMKNRLLPSFSTPGMYWVKAVLSSNNETIGVAGWLGPSKIKTHNIFRRSAIDFYGWKEQMGWSDEEIDEMWQGVNNEAWNVEFAKNDGIRHGLLDEPHWYLAPLLTWPEYQGRGVGKKLLSWAIDQADATEPVTPLYLESAPTARAVYMHCGFVPQGAVDFIRRGPAIVRGLEAEEREVSKEDVSAGKLDD